MYNLKYISDTGKYINFTRSENIWITDITGLTENTISFATSQGSSQIGTTIQGESIKDKMLVINGFISGSATAPRKQLIDTILPGEGGTLVFDNKLKLRVRPQVTPTIERSSENASFQFTLRAAYPYWQSIEAVAQDVAGLVPRFSFPINYGATNNSDPKTHIFGERIKSFFVNIENVGNVPAPFKVVFTAKAPVTNPQIIKVATLEYIKINKAMVTGEYITIDMTGDMLTVIDTIGNTSKNGFSYFEIDSTLFKLDVGDNQIKYDADSGRDTLDCRITYNPTFSGAYGDDRTYQ